MSDSVIITFALIAAVTGIAYGLYLAMWVFKLDAGNQKMQDIAKAIQEGASAYLNRQYRTVGRRGGCVVRHACGGREPSPINSAC